MRMRLIQIGSLLTLALGLSPAFAVENFKQELLTAVRQQMESTSNPGLSSRFFSVGDPDRLLPAVDEYLLGVAVDPDYLAHARTSKYLKSFVWTQNAERGLTQPRAEDAAWGDINLTPKEGRYSGWIILAERPDANEAASMTAFHEAIHAYHLHIGSDVDSDEHDGPENVSNTLPGLLFRLRMVDTELENIVRKIRTEKPYEPDLKKLEARLAIAERTYRSIDNPQLHAVLQNIGGRARWNEYETAIRQAVNDAEAVSPDTLRQFEEQIDMLETQVSAVEQKVEAFRQRLLRYHEDEAIFVLHARAATTGKETALAALDATVQDLTAVPRFGEYIQAVETATAHLRSETAELKGLYRLAAEGSQQVTEVAKATCDYGSLLGTDPPPTRAQIEQWLDEVGPTLDALVYGYNDMELRIETGRLSFNSKTAELDTLVQRMDGALSRLDAMVGANFFQRLEQIAGQLAEASKDLNAATQLKSQLLDELVELVGQRDEIHRQARPLGPATGDLLDLVRGAEPRLEARAVSMQDRVQSIESALDVQSLAARLPNVPDIADEISQARSVLDNVGQAEFKASLERGRQILSAGREAVSDAEAIEVAGAFAVRNIPAEIERAQACYASLENAREGAAEIEPQLLADFNGFIDACDFDRAGNLLAQMPEDPAKAEAESNYRAAIELKKKLEGYVATANQQYKAGHYEDAATTLESALAEAECAQHISSLEDKLATVEARISDTLYTQANKAVETCEFRSASQLIKGMPDGESKSQLQGEFRAGLTLQKRLQASVDKANIEYRRGDFKLALGTLQSALGEAKCERHITSLTDKIATVEGKLSSLSAEGSLSPAEQVANHDCSKYSNSHAEWDDEKQAPVCRCDSGFKANADGDACISVAAGPPACPQGRIWLVGENRCVGASRCQQIISGSIAQWNGSGYECNCPVDKTLVSNPDGRACVSRY